MDSWMQIQMSEETWDILGFLMIFHICLEMGFPVYLRKWHLNREKNDESVDFGVPYQWPYQWFCMVQDAVVVAQAQREADRSERASKM